MLVSEQMKITGRVKVDVVRGGQVVRTVEQDNLVTTAGKAAFAAILAGGTVLPGYVAIGTGTTAAALTDTALQSEVDRNQIAQRTTSGAVMTINAFFSKSEANGSTISEVGLLSDAAGGTLFARTILSDTVAKTSSESLSITWTITVA